MAPAARVVRRCPGEPSHAHPCICPADCSVSCLAIVASAGGEVLSFHNLGTIAGARLDRSHHAKGPASRSRRLPRCRRRRVHRASACRGRGIARSRRGRSPTCARRGIPARLPPISPVGSPLLDPRTQAHSSDLLRFSALSIDATPAPKNRRRPVHDRSHGQDHVGRLPAKLEQRDCVPLAVFPFETRVVRSGPRPGCSSPPRACAARTSSPPGWTPGRGYGRLTSPSSSSPAGDERCHSDAAAANAPRPARGWTGCRRFTSRLTACPAAEGYDSVRWVFAYTGGS
jgi:hypothetical protein